MHGTSIKQQLGRALKRRRLAIGLTQAELGAMVGKHRTNYSSIERGLTNIRFDTLVKLCAALNTRTWEVLLEAEGLAEAGAVNPPACEWAACPYKFFQAVSSDEPGGVDSEARSGL